MARERSDTVEFLPTSHNGRLLTQDEYIQRRDATTKEQLARLQQSAEYRKWAAARGRALRPGNFFLRRALLICVFVAAATTVSFWRSIPDAHVANPQAGKLQLAGQTSLSDTGIASDWSPTSEESLSLGELGSNQDFSAQLTKEEPGAASQELPAATGAVKDAPLETESGEQPQDEGEQLPKPHHQDRAEHQDAGRAAKETTVDPAEPGPGQQKDRADSREDVAGDSAKVPPVLPQPDGFESKEDGIHVNQNAAPTPPEIEPAAPTPEEVARHTSCDTEKANDALPEQLVEVVPEIGHPTALPALDGEGMPIGRAEGGAVHLLLLAAIFLATVYVFRFHLQQREIRRLRDKVQHALMCVEDYKRREEDVKLLVQDSSQKHTQAAHVHQAMESQAQQSPRRPAEEVGEEGALPGPGDELALMDELDGLKKKVGELEAQVHSAQLQRQQAEDLRNVVQHELDSKELYITELLNRLNEVGPSSSDNLKESPASSIVRTGQGGSRKALVSPPVRDESEAQQQELARSEECRNLRLQLRQAESELQEVNKKLQEVIQREAAKERSFNVSRQRAEGLQQQITELQQRNEELEQELEKRKAREKVELVLSPIRQSVQVRQAQAPLPWPRELHIDVDQPDILDVDPGSTSLEDLQHRVLQHRKKCKDAFMTVSALREERSDLAKSAAALKRADAGGAHINGGLPDGAGHAATLADSLLTAPSPEEGLAEAVLGHADDDPEVLRARVAQMTAGIAEMISYPGAEVELERLQRQVVELEAELSVSQAEARVAYDALQGKEEEVSHLKEEAEMSAANLDGALSKLQDLEQEVATLRAAGSVDSHAAESLEHLKEENALLQAQVDQVTASLMETQGAKQEAEQKLQSVKQDSDELAMMLGHQKGRIAMLEARLKHVLNVQHEAATRLSIDGQHVEALTSNGELQGRESLDTAVHRRERLFSTNNYLATLNSKINQARAILAGTVGTDLESPHWSTMTPSPLPSDIYRDFTPPPPPLQALPPHAQAPGQSGLAENSALWNRLSSFRELLHQTNEVIGSGLGVSLSQQDSLSCPPMDEDPASAQDRTPELAEGEHLLRTPTPEGHVSWGNNSVRSWEETVWASHGALPDEHPPLLSSRNFSAGSTSGVGGRAPAGVSPSLFPAPSTEEILDDDHHPARMLFDRSSPRAASGMLPEDPVGLAPTAALFEEPGEEEVEGKTSAGKSPREDETPFEDPEVVPQYCVDELQRSLGGSTLHARYPPEPLVLAQR